MLSTILVTILYVPVCVRKAKVWLCKDDIDGR